MGNANGSGGEANMVISPLLVLCRGFTVGMGAATAHRTRVPGVVGVREDSTGFHTTVGDRLSKTSLPLFINSL